MVVLSRGERFKDARLVHNQHGSQTMSVVKAATGVSESLIADLENDEKDRKVNYIDVAKLAKHYGVTTDWLCGLSEDHYPAPCASTELGISENSIYFLKSLNDVVISFEKLLTASTDDTKPLSKKWHDAVRNVRHLNGLSGYELRAHANFDSIHGLDLVDFLISVVENNPKIIGHFYDLQEADCHDWADDERIRYDDFIRFKAGEISKLIDRCLVEKYKNPDAVTVYYDQATDELIYED